MEIGSRIDRRPRVGVRTLIAALLSVCALGAAGAQRASPATEYEVKAAYVFNFLSFVTWPASAFASPTAPIVIGVVGDSPLMEPLRRVIQGEVVNGRPLEARRIDRVEDIQECHVLFTGAKGPRRQPTTPSAPLLTVGETDDFLPSGGVVRLAVTTDNRVVFDVNLEAMNRASLKPNARLLKVARRVVGATGGTDR